MATSDMGRNVPFCARDKKGNVGISSAESLGAYLKYLLKNYAREFGNDSTTAYRIMA